ncbi:MAG: CoA transferase [Burkholderiales bacterium]|nr:CoA transferase [Burkholderiales bacterium]
MNSDNGALAGLRVLDLTRILAGPFCTQMLGDMGADVIKVEPPGAGDDTRTWGPPFTGGESAYFLGINRNKRSLTLNLAAKAGQEILARLLPKCDVLIENYKLGTLEKWGFTNAWLEEHAPRVVRCSITGYGSSGPDAGLPGYDFILQAESGLMSVCGEPAGTPTKFGVAIVDVTTGLYACNVVLAALAARTRTGRGQHVEVCLYDSGISMLINVASSHLVTGRDARRYGNGHPSIVPYTTYPTADGMIALAVGNDGQFARFAQIAGHPEWGTDPRYAKNPDRVANRETLDPAIGEALKRDRTDAWIGKLRAAGVPCGPIHSVAEALNDPHTLARGLVRTVEHPAAGQVKMVGIPYAFSDTPATIRRPPPLLGQHTDEVLREELGFTAERIAQLRAEKVV